MKQAQGDQCIFSAQLSQKLCALALRVVGECAGGFEASDQGNAHDAERHQDFDEGKTLLLAKSHGRTTAKGRRPSVDN